MTFRAGKFSAVAINNIDGSPFLNSADWSSMLGTAETTHLGSSHKEFIPGVEDGTCNLSGMYDYANHSNPTAEAVSGDIVLNNLIGLVNDFPVTLMFDGGWASGRRAQIFIGKATTYNPASPVAGVVSAKVAIQQNGRLNDAFCLSAAAPLTTTTPYIGSSVDGIAASLNGGLATVHVTANTWTGTTSVKVQHSTDNSVWTDLLTQVVPAATQAGYILTAAGTINRYVRANITPAAGSGSVSVVVAFARN